MNPNTIKEHLKESPFVPFEIVTASGSRYAVHHPEMVMPTRLALYVFRPEADGFVEPCKIGYPSISEIVPLEGKAA